MANLPGRNGVASSIHYPLPQPATTPMGQAQTQQIVWHFTAPATFPRVIQIAIFGTISLLARLGLPVLTIAPRIGETSIILNEPE